MEKLYSGLFIGCMTVLAVCLLLCLIRAVKGPKPGDRIVAVNMMGTMVMIMIALMSVLLAEPFLLDVAIIYAAISFLSVVVLTRIYTGVYREKEHQKQLEQAQKTEEKE